MSALSIVLIILATPFLLFFGCVLAFVPFWILGCVVGAFLKDVENSKRNNNN
jgi:hypothetical protein